LQTSFSTLQYRVRESLEHLLQDSLYRNAFIYWMLLKFAQAYALSGAQGLEYYSSQLLLFAFAIELFSLFLVLKCLPSKIIGPLDTLQIFTAIFLTIPLITLTFNNSRFTSYTNYSALLCVIFFHYMLRICKRLIRVNLTLRPLIRISMMQIAFLLILLSLFLVATILTLGEFTFNISELDLVYARRIDFMESITETGNSLFGYAFGWLGGVIAPLIFLFGIYLKRYTIIIFSLVLGLFVYAGAAQKWILASYFFIILVFYLCQKGLNLKNSSSMFFIGFNWMIVGALIFQTLFSKSRIIDLAVRRALMDPAIMLQHYVEFTRDYSFRFWQDTRIGQFFNIDSGDPAARIIGDRYFNIPTHFYQPRQTQSNATAGALADSISQAGLLGLFLTTLLIFLFFVTLEVFSKGKSKPIVLCVSALSVEMLMEGTLHTLMLTRGLIIIPLVLYLLPNQENLKEEI